MVGDLLVNSRFIIQSMARQTILFRDLGLMGYSDAWAFQEELLRANVEEKSKLYANPSPEMSGAVADTKHYLLFTEHPAVYTLGKSGDMAHVLLDEASLKARGIEFYRTNRGGDITFHGPQQIVGYPVIDLEKFYTDIGRYLRNLEEVIILTMAEYGLKGERSAGETGVWLDPHLPGRERKICAIGVRSSRWVTMHGFAFNVNTDLNYFNFIIPCGIQHKQVTSLQKELGHVVPMEEVKEKVKRNFALVFEADIVAG